MIMIYRISGTDSGTDSGVPMPVQTRAPRGGRGARERRRALSGGLSPAGAPCQKPAQRADGVLNAGPAGDDGLDLDLENRIDIDFASFKFYM